MAHRLMLLKLVTLMLYTGPLLAGLAAQGWNVLPVFVAIFALWQVVMRPADWPGTLAGWQRPGAAAAAVLRVAVLVALVAAMFGIGRGIGAVTGSVLAVPLAATVSLSFLAVPLARLIWDPAQGAAMDALLDGAIAKLGGAGAGTEEAAAARSEVSPLLLLPADAPEASAQAGLEAILSSGDSPARWRALAEALVAAPAAHGAVRQAFVLWATDPANAARWEGRGLLAEAFRVAGADPTRLRLYAARASAIAAAQPGSWADFPRPDLRASALSACPDPEVSRLLTSLSDRIDALAPADASATPGARA